MSILIRFRNAPSILSPSFRMNNLFSYYMIYSGHGPTLVLTVLPLSGLLYYVTIINYRINVVANLSGYT